MAGYGSAGEYFDHISGEITEEQAKSLQGIFNFDIQGAGNWLIEFTEDGEAKMLDPQRPVDPDCTIRAKEKDWLDIVSGDTKPMSAFITGKLKVEGSTSRAMKLQQILGQ